MANLTMTNWRIEDKLPYINLGSAGENNASMVTITVDALIENANYYLDIGDESGSGLPNTQELTPSSNEGTNDETIYTLSMQPMVTWLGKEGVKLLQVRCVYTENDKQVVKESNVFHAKVDRNSGFVYKYDIAVFEEYLNKIKESGGGSGDYVTEDELIEALSSYTTKTEVDDAIDDAVVNKQDKYNNIYTNVPQHYIALNNAISNSFNKPNSYLVYDQLDNVFLLTVEKRQDTSATQSILLKIIALSNRTHNINLKFYYQPITSSVNPQPLYLYVNGYVRVIQLSGEFADISFGNYEDDLPTSEYEWEQYNPVTFINQVIEMPTANILTLGNIYQYVGDTDENYTNGLFYECVSDGEIIPTYSWIVKNVIDLPITKGNGTNAIITNDSTNNVANGNFSHAEGSNTRASGNFSHSEGAYSVTSSSAIGGHAEGQSIATGQYAHSQNYNTNAVGQYQTTIGKYNVLQGTSSSVNVTDHALIIGNGTDADHRSNALAVQWDGNVVFQDGSKQKSSPYAIMGKLGAKNLVTSPYIDDANVTTINGINYTLNSDGSITFSGTATGFSYYIINKDVLRKLGVGNYILNAHQSSSFPTGCGVLLLDNDTAEQIAKIWHDNSEYQFEITQELVSHNSDLRITINAGVVIDTPITIYPMLRYADDTDDTYYPYAKTNLSLTNTSNNIINSLDMIKWSHMHKNNNPIIQTIEDDFVAHFNFTTTSFDNSTWYYGMISYQITDLIEKISKLQVYVSNTHNGVDTIDTKYYKFNVLKLSNTYYDWASAIDLSPMSYILQHQNDDFVIDLKQIVTNYKETIASWDNVYLMVGYNTHVTPDVSYIPTDIKVKIKYYYNEIINDDVVTPSIVCWGDSLTAGGGWTQRLSELSGLTVYNGGTGGENAQTIMARQGGDIMIANNIIIPSTTTAVTIATRADGGIDTEFGNKALPLLQGGSNHVNPVLINDVLGTLSWTGSDYSDPNGTWTFTRNTSGDTINIDRPTAIRTMYDRLNNDSNDIMIVFMGQNGWGSNDVNDLINMHKLMIDHFKGKEYVVLGLSSGTASSRADYEEAMTKEFGRRFISLRQYLAHPIYDGNNNIVSCYGLADQNLTPTSDDLDEIAIGQVPSQLLRDSVHYTDGTKIIIGDMLYKKMCELNIL